MVMDSAFLRLDLLLTEKPILMRVSKMATVLRRVLKMRVMMMQMVTL